ECYSRPRECYSYEFPEDSDLHYRYP
ncbi:hypothetical protein CEXT_535891, partial [Caerostris extrusa]